MRGLIPKDVYCSDGPEINAAQLEKGSTSSGPNGTKIDELEKEIEALYLKAESIETKLREFEKQSADDEESSERREEVKTPNSVKTKKASQRILINI